MHCSDISKHRRESASSRCAFRFPLDEGSLSGRCRQMGCLGASEEFDRSWRNSIEAASGIDIRRMYLTRSGFSPGIQLPQRTAPIEPRMSIFAGESNLPNIAPAAVRRSACAKIWTDSTVWSASGWGTTISRGGFLRSRSWLQRAEMSELRDSIYHSQLARKARQLASAHSNPIVARHLRETAIMHDRQARKLARLEAAAKAPKRGLRRLFWFL